MKWLLKTEELALLLFFSFLYFHVFNGSWLFFLSLFFVPDVSFMLYLISKKAMILVYNFMHHKGIMLLVLVAGYLLQNEVLSKIGLIFLAHSSLDRVVGYGLKYTDNPDHTHLGWVGKSKSHNVG